MPFSCLAAMQFSKTSLPKPCFVSERLPKPLRIMLLSHVDYPLRFLYFFFASTFVISGSYTCP